MTDGKYPPLTDNMDDLPRTLRRERDNRERLQREQQQREQQAQLSTPPAGRGQMPAAQPSYGAPEPVHPYDAPYVGAASDTASDVIVTKIKVPFFSLMGFFIKAVFAAIPALLILIAMLWALGMALQIYFPQLIKMKILISFPG